MLRPDGKEGIFGTVEYGIGVSIIALDVQHNIYLIREYDYILEEYGIKTPSGGVDGKEPIIKAAKRELIEETGLESENWKELGYVNPLTMVIKVPQYLFLAQDVQKIHEKVEGEIEVMKVPFDTAYQWVMENKITHSPSCVGILKTKILLPLK